MLKNNKFIWQNINKNVDTILCYVKTSFYLAFLSDFQNNYKDRKAVFDYITHQNFELIQFLKKIMIFLNCEKEQYRLFSKFLICMILKKCSPSSITKSFDRHCTQNKDILFII